MALRLVTGLLDLGSALREERRPAEAMASFEEAREVLKTIKPKDTALSMKVAPLQAWFGRESDLAATRRRILALAKDANDANTAERAAKVCSVVASADKAELDAALALARTALRIDQRKERESWELMALGMVEYRSGNHLAAEEALRAAVEAGPTNAWVTGISAFYRAMSLFRQNKIEQARRGKCSPTSAATFSHV